MDPFFASNWPISYTALYLGWFCLPCLTSWSPSFSICISSKINTSVFFTLSVLAAVCTKKGWNVCPKRKSYKPKSTLQLQIKRSFGPRFTLTAVAFDSLQQNPCKNNAKQPLPSVHMGQVENKDSCGYTCYDVGLISRCKNQEFLKWWSLNNRQCKTLSPEGG